MDRAQQDEDARATEEIIDPSLPIVDPHHHLWDRPNNRYLFTDLLKDVTSGHNIVATLFVECGAMYRQHAPEPMRPVGEVEFAAGAAAMGASGLYGKHGICAGIVGHVDLSRPEWVEPVVAAEVAASGMRLRGIRHQACWDPDASIPVGRFVSPRGLLNDGAFRSGFAQLRKLGLNFEAWLYHHQLAELTDLARAFPDTSIVLNHIGAPLGMGVYAGRREEVFEAWRKAIHELATCGNVVVKLGGLGMPIFGFGFDTRPGGAPSDPLAQAWRPYLETCIEAFGPSRCMFESNFPVDRVSGSYVATWNAFKRVTANYSNDEKSFLFSRTARRIYRL